MMAQPPLLIFYQQIMQRIAFLVLRLGRVEGWLWRFLQAE
jgi:hypothetical protein